LRRADLMELEDTKNKKLPRPIVVELNMKMRPPFVENTD